MDRIEQRSELNLGKEKSEPVQRVAAVLRVPILGALRAMEGLPGSTLRVLTSIDKPKTPVQDSAVNKTS